MALFMHGNSRPRGGAINLPTNALPMYCGTSNIVLPVRNKTEYPEIFRNSSRLEYYASLFNSIEINSTFYKLPLPATVVKWASLVPDEFRFTVKLSKLVTHQKDLIFDPSDIEKFFTVTDGFAGKKGCVLVQFPAGAKADLSDQFEDLLGRITQYNHGWQLAVEFRDKSWYYERIYRLIETANGCLVEHDMPRSKTPAILPDSSTRYLRFHGECGDYRGCYTDQFLSNLSAEINTAEANGATVYAYFNNTMGDAVHNAISLQNLQPPGS
jgi:uncharacterized protein YecE (DUF72 family)